MADSKITPRTLKLNLHDAAEAAGVSEQKILGLAAEGEVIAGIIVPHWDAHAVPAHGGCRISASKTDRINGKFVTTEYAVEQEGQPDVRVPVFTISRFWRICAGDMVFALNGEPITIRYLLPYGALDKETAPWPETVFKLEREHTINAKDFWFVLEEAEDNPQPAAPDAAPEKTSKTFTAPDGTKGEKQEAAVLYWIAHKNLNPLEVPDGEKGTIKDMCEKGEETGQLFRAPTAFAETWRRLRKNEIVRMASHDSYAHRGN